MNKKAKIAIPIVAGVLAVGTGLGVVAAKNAAQPYSASLSFDTTPTPTPTVTPTPTPGARLGPGFCGRGGGLFRMFGRQAIQVTAGRIATLLGITTDQLKPEVQSGKTLADIAKDHGVSQDKLVQTILAPVSDEMDVLVKYGYMTKDQETNRLQQAQNAVNKLVTSKMTIGPKAGPSGTPAPQSRRGGMMGGLRGMMKW